MAKLSYFCGMENDYLQKINLDLLQRDMGMSLEQIAELVDINPKAIYKWAYSKNNGGARPTYNAITLLKERGASDKALFGLEIIKSTEPDDKEFSERVKDVLRSMLV